MGMIQDAHTIRRRKLTTTALLVGKESTVEKIILRMIVVNIGIMNAFME